MIPALLLLSLCGEVEPLLSWREVQPGLVCVSGSEKTLHRFLEDWQTARWPKWRDNPDAVRWVNQKKKEIRSVGNACFWVTSEDERAAFNYAVRQYFDRIT